MCSNVVVGLLQKRTRIKEAVPAFLDHAIDASAILDFAHYVLA